MCCDGFWKKEAKALVEKTKKTVSNIGKTVEQIIKNPLPVIETAALITVGVPPPVASAAVTAMNGGSVKDIVNAGIVSYGAAYVAGSVAGKLPEGTSATTVKIVSSAAGADAATTIKSLASGKSLDAALKDGLVAGASAGAGTAAGGLVENKIGAGAASGAASGATTAALTGKDIGKAAIEGAKSGAIKPATDVALGAAKDALGNIPTPNLTGASDILKTIKEQVAPYVDPVLAAAKQVGETVKPYVDPVLAAAKEKLQPVGEAISAAAKPVGEAISAAAKPVGEAISSVTKPVGEAITSAGKSIKEAAAPIIEKLASVDVPNNSLTQALNEAPNLYHDQQVMAQMSKTPNVPAPAGATVSQSTTGSPAAYGATDVAMLDSTSPEGMGSKVSKKGGKYPWGDPEGTTALKQEGQVV
jgi:hypothetical protein